MTVFSRMSLPRQRPQQLIDMRPKAHKMALQPHQVQALTHLRGNLAVLRKVTCRDLSLRRPEHMVAMGRILHINNSNSPPGQPCPALRKVSRTSPREGTRHPTICQTILSPIGDDQHPGHQYQPRSLHLLRLDLVAWLRIKEHGRFCHPAGRLQAYHHHHLVIRCRLRCQGSRPTLHLSPHRPQKQHPPTSSPSFP
jgi:hypothetical protein